jgi:hypothetical protein
MGGVRVTCGKASACAERGAHRSRSPMSATGCSFKHLDMFSSPSPNLPPILWKSRPTSGLGKIAGVDRTRRCLVRQLPDGVANPVPGRRAVGIAVGRRLVGARGVFLKRLLAVALDHQVGGAPDIDLGHHARKPHAYDVSTLITKACGLGKCACQGSRGRGGRGRSGRMALILTAEDVVPRITA